MYIIGPFLIMLAIVTIIVLVDKEKEKERKAKENEYYASSYYAITHNNYYDVYNDDGKWQEYKISQKLRKYEDDGAKMLFNAYIPKYNGTTELDVILITKYGLFVFESKNYSGWIFGSANQRNWVQCLRTGRYSTHKEYFYNPIKQNETHINYLRRLMRYNVPVHSVIVFSDRCEFRGVEVDDADAEVLYLCQTDYPVRYAYENHQVRLSQNEIQELYDAIYPYTQVSEDVKQQQHVNALH